MGPTLARMAQARRGCAARDRSIALVVAPPSVAQRSGVETIRVRPARPRRRRRASRCAERRLHGRSEIRHERRAGNDLGDERRRARACAPSDIAGSRIVAFSTGNVYPLMPAQRGGSRENDAAGPVGEYAVSCLGRERMFEHCAARHGTPCRDRAPQLRDRSALRRARRPRARCAARRARSTSPWATSTSSGRAMPTPSRSSAVTRAHTPPFVVNVAGRDDARRVRISPRGSARGSARTPTFTGAEAARRAAQQHARMQSTVRAARADARHDARVGRRMGRSAAARLLGKPTKFETARWKVLTLRGDACAPRADR